MLPYAEAAINSAYHGLIGDSPDFCMFLRDKKLVFEPCKVESTEIVEMDEKIATMIKRRDVIYKTIEETLENEEAAYITRINKRSQDFKILEGSRIFLKRRTVAVGLKAKLCRSYIGPFRVLEVLENNRLRVLDIAKQTEQIVHANQVKPVPERSNI